MSRTVHSTPPGQTREERLRRLQMANDLRRRRADDKRALRARELNALDILEDCPAHWRNAKCAELLLTIPAIGQTKTERILMHTAISPSRSLAALTDQQRARLRAAIEPYCQR